MGKLSIKQIQDIAARILEESPDGVRFAQLWKLVCERSPETPPNTISGAIVSMSQVRSDVEKPSKGFFKHVKFMNADSQEKELPAPKKAVPKEGLKEEDLYEPFARWLCDEMEEASHAVPLGGAVLKGKWGTPDVIGVYKPKKADLVQFFPEIICAEIKIDSSQVIVAFGQAMAYRLFSHKVYVVIPKNSAEEDIARLESLCMIFGIGFAEYKLESGKFLFNARVRPSKSSPDMFYVNEFARRLHTIDAKIFEQLF